MKRPIMDPRALRVALPLAGLGAVAAALSGCGGASTNVGGVSAPTLASGPVIYGNNAAAIISGSTILGETSGLSFTDPVSGAATGALVGAIGYQTTNGAGPLPVYQLSFPNGVLSNGFTSSPGLPLGFAPGGAYYNVSSPVEALPTTYAGNVVFGVYVSTGTFNSKPADLVTTSIVLTSPEAPTFSEPLAFDPNFGSGVLAQDQYKTAPFAVPTFLKTTGIHDLHTTVADVAGQSSTTDFAIATVSPADVALFLQSITVLVPAVPATGTTPAKPATTVTTAIAPGDTVTLDGGAGIGVYPTGYMPTIADAQGTVVLFTTPGTHTVTETDPTGKTVQTETFTLAATTAGTTLLSPPTPDGAPVASARPLVIHPAAKRTVKR